MAEKRVPPLFTYTESRGIEQMRRAIRMGTSFNLIDRTRGEKADLFPLSADPRYQRAFENRMRRRVEILDTPAFDIWTARVEDVVVG